MTTTEAEKQIAEEERLKKELEDLQLKEAATLRRLAKKRAAQQKNANNPWNSFWRQFDNDLKSIKQAQDAAYAELYGSKRPKE